MRKRRYRNMPFVYPRSNGIYEIRYPIPDDVRSYFPKSDGSSFKSHVIVSLGTRDQAEANRLAASKFPEIEQKFSVLRGGAISSDFYTFCRQVFEAEMDAGSRRNLEFSVPQPEIKIDGVVIQKATSKSESYRAHELHALITALDSEDPAQLEAVAGWVVDVYLQNAADFSASIPHDSPRRNELLFEAAAVLRDVYTQLASDIHDQTVKPKLRASSLRQPSAAEASPGDNALLPPEARLSLAKYWDIHAKTKQGSSAPVAAHTLERRQAAWKELAELLGPDTPLFKVTRADIWRYCDELKKAPARAGSYKALRDLSFPERVDAMRRNPSMYDHLDLDSIGDRLRQINAVFAMAVTRGHLDKNPSQGINESKRGSVKAREAYSDAELQRIFSSAPFDKPVPLELQTDEFWVPLLELFLGARASELYLRTSDVMLSHKVPHLRLVEFDERSLKNPSSARALPIHPALTELGFIDYCRLAKARGTELFPAWQFRVGQKPSEGAGRRRFNRNLRKLLPDRGGFPADSHTFRHTFETALSVAENVPERVSARLSGRSIGGSAATYVHDLRMLPDLADAISKVRYPDLSLKHLRVSA